MFFTRPDSKGKAKEQGEISGARPCVTGPGFDRKQLLQEGLRRCALVERSQVREPASLYYGISASRRSEPLDQLDVLLLVARLRQLGLDISLTIFVAGRYAELNGRLASELVPAEDRKMAMLTAAGRALGLSSRGFRLIRTNDLWYSPDYWQGVERLKDEPGIISPERKGEPFLITAQRFEPELRSAIPPSLMDALGPLDSPSLYRLFEVAEAVWLAKNLSVDSKIGPVREQEYDRFIGSFMDVIQLRQPLDFRSSAACPKPVTPYIGKAGEERIFLSDSKSEAGRKVYALAQRATGQPLFFGDFMNPFVRLSILAVEAASAAESVPVRMGGSALSDGAGVLTMFEKAGTASLARFAGVVTECLWAYLIKPIRKEETMGGALS